VRQRLLTDVNAAFFRPGIGLFGRFVFYQLDPGDEAALPHIADVWMFGQSR
jgi:hypothetical protein